MLRVIRRITSGLRRHGLRGFAAAISHRIVRRRARCFATCAALVEGRSGLEIGGPSAIFSSGGLLPLYPLADRLENCNYALATLWEGAIREGLTFHYDPKRPPGRQYLAEATDLAPVSTGAYDFVLSSHTLEHTANPVRALREWIRTLKAEGVLVLVVPHKEGTFDHRRPVTPLAHLLDDWARGTTEEDLTHLPEILALHDLTRDPQAGDRENFRNRCERNFENRGLHHHVFDTKLVVDIIDCVGLQILAVEPMWPFHIILVARKVPSGRPANNEGFKGAAPEYRRTSPFRTDRSSQ